MLLGKRSRPPMRRTTSMKEFALDLSHLEQPSDQNTSVTKPQPACAGLAVTPQGFDPRFLSTVSPRTHRRSSAHYLETPHFLRTCGFCQRRLAPGKDIYMYRGDTAFCSLECRQQQMNQDEGKDKCSMASTATGAKASSKGETVAAA